MIIIHKYKIYPVKDSVEWGIAYNLSKYKVVFILFGIQINSENK